MSSTKLRYSSDCQTLPVNRPLGFPHLIDLHSYTADETDITDLRLADGIATFLWEWDKREFDRFFDLATSEFEVHRQSHGINMVISRVGHVVTAVFAEAEGLEFDPKLVFEIQWNGSWKPVFCYSNSLTRREPEIVEEGGRDFAKSILDSQVWVLSPLSKQLRKLKSLSKVKGCWIEAQYDPMPFMLMEAC